MRFVHCETYQGAIAAVHVESTSRERDGRLPTESDLGIISPVVLTHFGESTFLPSVGTIAEAIASAKAHIERENQAYIHQVLDDRIAASEAVQHFQNCAIPLEMVPTLVTELPYYPLQPLFPVCCSLSKGFPYCQPTISSYDVTASLLSDEP